MGTCTEMGTHPTDKIGGWALARKWALTQLAKLGGGDLHGNVHLLKTTHYVKKQTHRCLCMSLFISYLGLLGEETRPGIHSLGFGYQAGSCLLTA